MCDAYIRKKEISQISWSLEQAITQGRLEKAPGCGRGYKTISNAKS